MWFIGDIHGCFHWYLTKGIKAADCSLQLGDFGWGFDIEKNKRGKILKESLLSKDLSSIKTMPQHKFLCGNHDDRKFAASHPNYVGDFGYVKNADLFYISGAFSIDFKLRTEGIDWWSWEQLDPSQLDEMITMFADTKPRIVASHCAPLSAQVTMFPHSAKNLWINRTQVVMEDALNLWQPERWYFGHCHMTKHCQSGKTRFQCVGIEQRVELPGVNW
jgi:hypothetical protein